MPVATDNPTPYPEVNALLRELLASVQAILGSQLIGMYLDGSLASGDFDPESDIDFVVVTENEISGDLFPALKAMHERVAAIDSGWAIQLEGSYLSQRAVRRYDPARALYPNIERGKGERLKMVRHDETWVIHRCILREQGITLAGPDPRTLIDPVTPTQVREGMLSLLSGWALRIPDEPAAMKNRGSQSYIVLSLCRILYTLQYGTVVSKSAAARWAQETLDGRWVLLIERAWTARYNWSAVSSEVSSEEVDGTLEFIRYAREHSCSSMGRMT